MTGADKASGQPRLEQSELEDRVPRDYCERKRGRKKNAISRVLRWSGAKTLNLKRALLI